MLKVSQNTIFFLCLFTCKLVLADDLFIPQSKEEGIYWVKMGVLDSIIWSQIEEYYDYGINVPSGELLILESIFPPLRNRVPIDSVILNKYSPWSERDITHFYRDFPHLVSFRPILTFERTSQKYKNNLSFHGRRFISDTSGLYKLKYRYSDDRWQFNGIADLTFTYGRWNKRNFSYKPKDRIEIQIGNFKLTDMKELYLFLGYFPKDTNSYNSISENWLYSSSPYWNGIALNYSGTHRFLTFAHTRSSEFITGFHFDYAFAKENFCKLGMYNIVCKTSNIKKWDTLIYPIVNLKNNRKNLQYNVIVAPEIYSFSRISIPLALQVQLFQNKLEHFCIESAYLPKSFFGPRSTIRNLYNNEAYFDANDLLILLTSYKVHLHNYLTSEISSETNLLNWSLSDFKQNLKFIFLIGKGVKEELSLTRKYHYLDSLYIIDQIASTLIGEFANCQEICYKLSIKKVRNSNINLQSRLAYTWQNALLQLSPSISMFSNSDTVYGKNELKGRVLFTKRNYTEFNLGSKFNVPFRKFDYGQDFDIGLSIFFNF